MPSHSSSRELSERVEIEFQKRPNRFRRRIWWGSLWLSIATVVWLGYEGARGDFHIFEGGEVAQSHKLFENDCAKCHTTWAPVQRVMALDFSTKVYSVENSACLACHPGSTHHENQIPIHDGIYCAHCHVEHIGEHDLKRVTDRVCTECHVDLKTIDGSPLSFVASVSDISTPAGHPEFAFKRLLESSSPDADSVGEKHKVRALLEFVDGKGWQDRAKIKFNHSAHLKSERDDAGNLVYGIIGKDQRLNDKHRFTDLSQACDVCHTMDQSGEYMLPIVYEQHCRECHPLTFDARRFPGATVPHERADVVRGFLTEQYTLAAVTGQQQFEQDTPQRIIPGRRSNQKLAPDQAQWVADQVHQAEEAALWHGKILGPSGKGGCAYCHTLSDSAGKVIGSGPDLAQRDATAGWNIVPPEIPDRWLPHSRFNHASHQMLNCAECHGAAEQSKDTGDVMMPGVALCRNCHSSDPIQPGEDSPARYFGARTDCAECHSYHDHTKDNFTGTLNPLLGLSGSNRTAPSTGESSK